MSKKFTLPKKFKCIPNTTELINWYEHKLLIMENRQKRLSKLLSIIFKKLKG